MMYNTGRYWVVLPLLLLVCMPLWGQVNVEIVGETANGAGKRVDLLCYEDMLTMREVVLDETEIDSTGAFRLGCYLRYPRMVVVQVECYSQTFYAEPGRRYEVWLPEFRWEQDEERNVHLDPVALPLEFLNLPDDELNVKILHFEEAVDSFVSEHRVFFDPRFKPRREWMDSLSGKWRTEIGGQGTGNSDSFFDRYVRFTLAQMRYDLRFATRSQMLRGVLDGEVLYHDECYMRTLFDVLGGMVSKGMRRVPKWRLTEWVHAGDVARYLDSLGTEPLLYDEQLRELAAIVALKESLHDMDYEPEEVLLMLHKIGERSKWKEHRELAERIVENGERRVESGELGVENGERSVMLPDVDGNRVDVMELMRGKWVYLSFVRVGDPTSLRELGTMAHFKDSVYARNRNVIFVTVACDREFQKMYHFLRNSRGGNRYNWTWLHFDSQYRWLEQIGVVSYPSFLLLTPEGRPYYSFTPWPESGILMHGPWENAESGERRNEN